MNKHKNDKKSEMFLSGGFLAVIGLIALAQGQFQAALFLLGVGIVMMAASLDERTRKKVFDFFFSIFESLWKILGGARIQSVSLDQKSYTISLCR